MCSGCRPPLAAGRSSMRWRPRRHMPTSAARRIHRDRGRSHRSTFHSLHRGRTLSPAGHCSIGRPREEAAHVGIACRSADTPTGRWLAAAIGSGRPERDHTPVDPVVVRRERVDLNVVDEQLRGRGHPSGATPQGGEGREVVVRVSFACPPVSCAVIIGARTGRGSRSPRCLRPRGMSDGFPQR